MTAPSAFAVDLLASISDELAEEGPLQTGTMFRSPGLRVGAKIFVFLGNHDRLIIKVPRVRAEHLIADGQAHPVTMGTRTLREWIAIPAGTDREETFIRWVALAREALTYVREIS